MRFPYLVKLRLLQVVPLELRVQVGQGLHTKVVKVGQLLNLIWTIIYLLSISSLNLFWCWSEVRCETEEQFQVVSKVCRYLYRTDPIL